MRVLIITGIFPPESGGPATYVPRIATQLTKSGHLVKVITLSDELDHNHSHYPFEVMRIKRGKFKPIRILETFLNIVRYGLKSDLLFVNGLGAESAIANLFIRKPMVVKLVGDWAWERARNRGLIKDSLEDFQKKKYNFKLFQR